MARVCDLRCANGTASTDISFHADEDSSQILAIDCDDDREQLWRVQEGHSINYHDLPSGRYLALGLDHEEPRIVNFDAKRTAADFTPAAIARRGTR